MTDVVTMKQENCLLDTPYEILFEIFRRLPRCKLIVISRLCLKFRRVVGDTRFWKDVNIKYGSKEKYPFKTFVFEDLYTEPWPVKVINLSHTKINPPVSLQTEQMIKVANLHLSSIEANKVTIAAILARYQCTELHLDGDILEIGPEAFSKQTALEVLSVKGKCLHSNENCRRMYFKEVHQLLAPIFEYFKNLETLDLRFVSLLGDFGDFDMLGFIKTLPTSLEKLYLRHFPEDSFIELLAGRIPNLKELKVWSCLKKKYQSLLKFQFLEVLEFLCSLPLNRLCRRSPNSISDLGKYLTKFPALKTVYFIEFDVMKYNNPEAFLENLQTMLQPHGIIVASVKSPDWPPYPKEGNVWEVSKSM